MRLHWFGHEETPWFKTAADLHLKVFLLKSFWNLAIHNAKTRPYAPVTVPGIPAAWAALSENLENFH